jgi:hypothetical protein
LSSVSVAPSPLRSAAVVLDNVGAGAVPSKSLAEPYPTKSRTPAATWQDVQVSAVWLVTRATLPELADMKIVPVASGVGSGVVPPAPCASWTR